MLVYHVTPRANLQSILQTGLDPARSRGKLRCVWTVTRAKLLWALLHVAKKTGLPLQEISVIKSKVPSVGARKRWEGVYSFDDGIHKLEICQVWTASDLIPSDPAETRTARRTG